jgi:glyoxylase-like metal-dependent hydrolase (beta-lactamase superfamily II)
MSASSLRFAVEGRFALEKIEALERIADNIYVVHARSGGRFPYSNSILITEDNGANTLIDTGCGIETLNEIKQRIRVSSVINSHTHPDHSAGNWVFKGIAKSINVPKEGFETSGNMTALSERLAEPGWLAEYWRDFVSRVMNFRNCEPTDSFNSQTHFRFGEISLLPIYTPGHTIDHYCFYEPNKKVLFSFDYDLTSFGPWYGHRESSISAFKESIEKLKGLDVGTLVSGHREIIRSDIKKRLGDFGTKFDERSEKILGMLTLSGKTIAQLVNEAPIYGKYPYAEPLLRYWEGNMIRKHLDELVDQGRAVRAGEQYRTT